MAVVKKLISLDNMVADELEMVSSALNVTQKEIIERALDFYFDHTDTILAQQISKDVEDGIEKVHDAKEVFADMGLNDV